MHIFDRDMTLSQDGENRFTGTLSDSWLINNVQNGGYMMAFIAKAMLKLSNKRATPIITANYILRCKPGPAEVRVEQFSSTAQFDRLQASLFQEGKERIRSFGTFAAEKHDCTVERYESPPPDIAPRETCAAIPAIPNYSLMSNVDIRLDPACAGWMKGALSDRSEQKGWINFRKERPHDILSVLMIADAMPPAVMASRGMMAWVPTIELSVNIRNMPASSWLKFSLRTRFITCGLVEEDGEVWDEAGNLVSISRQIAQFRTGS